MKNKNPIANILPMMLVLAFLAFMFLSTPLGSQTSKLTYPEFKIKVQNKTVKKASVVINSNTVTIQGTYTLDKVDYPYSITIPNTEQELNDILSKLNYNGLDVEYVDANQKSFLSDLLMSIVPTIAILVLGF